MAKKKEKNQIIEIEKPKKKIIRFLIIGDTPINIHRLGKKAKQELEDRGKKKASARKIRNYEEEFMDSLYFIDANGNEIESPKKITKSTRIGFPASGLKKAMVSAARNFKNVTMAEIRGKFFVLGRFIEIKGTPKQDGFWRRIGGKGPGTGTPDWGIRAKVEKWSSVITVRYVENWMTPESIANLLDAAGFCVGLGEDRPDKTGNDAGMWHIASAKGE